MEVKIGVQNASRELTIDTTLDADGVEKAVDRGPQERRRPRAHRREGPADRRTRREARLRRHLHQRQRAGRLPLLTGQLGGEVASGDGLRSRRLPRGSSTLRIVVRSSVTGISQTATNVTIAISPAIRKI